MERDRFPVDNSPPFNELITSVVTAEESSTKNAMILRFVSKCGLCAPEEWNDLANIIESNVPSETMRTYLLKVGRIGYCFARQHGEPSLETELRQLVRELAIEYPNDQLLSTPIGKQ